MTTTLIKCILNSKYILQAHITDIKLYNNGWLLNVQPRLELFIDGDINIV